MAKSERLAAAAELAVARLVGECRELGDDSTAWQAHLAGGLVALCGGLVAWVGAGSPPGAAGAGLGPAWVPAGSAGAWASSAVRDRWLARASDPAMVAAHPAAAAFVARPEPDLTLTRRELVSDAAWGRSAFVNELLRADGMDEGLVSRRRLGGTPGSYVITLVRAAGDAPFRADARRLVERVQRELGPHLGRSLLLTTQPSLRGLTPGARCVLERLLDGDSEKEAALRLGLRPGTVHDHVKRLYKHFGVNSRAELLAHFLRRYRRRDAGRP